MGDMLSNSSANLFDEGSVGIFDPPLSVGTLPRVMTVPGIISNLYEGSSSDEDRDTPASVLRERKILVANVLPLHSIKDKKSGEWCFTWDEDSLLLQLKDGFSPETEVIYVGSLTAEIDAKEQEKVAQKLLEEFKCIPTFLPPDLQEKFYQGFCKQHLWPLFHYMLPFCIDKGELFDRSLFQAYISANKIFANKVMEVINTDDDFIWVHDYHLMLLPTFLRKRMHRVKLGFFLHSPFPSSEIYRTLPVREEILRGLLNADLIGFHTFDYARHFLSCCSRMLGLNYESKRGYIGLDYSGRMVNIKILPVGVHIGRLQSVLKLPTTISKVREIKQKFKGKKIILGIDDMDIFKGISLKLLGLELLLKRNPKLKGKLVLVQIANPARGTGKDVEEARTEVITIAERINRLYGDDSGYQPIVLIDYSIPFYEKIAFFVEADCCIVNAVRDGMNLVPYEYIVCREGTEEMDKSRGIDTRSPHTSALIVSEFVGCSPSLSGAFRVNPWSVEDVADALQGALDMKETERELRHEKHYRYVSSHHVAYWARSFMQDLERACKDHYSRRCWGIGLGLGFKVIALSPSFRKLSVDHLVSSYKRTGRRAIFLDYDGTIMPETSISKSPRPEIISILNNLCSDPKNTVFIVSGRGRTSLGEWFSLCSALGIAAEHGYFIRWKGSEWEPSPVVIDSDWMKIAEPVMRLYTETTDGSYIEKKESALVWHYQDSDYDFGSCQAKELLDHLESVLANDPVVVKRGKHIVEVKPQGVSKGLAVHKLLETMISKGEVPDFVMCVGDDRSDEDMFESINCTASSTLFSAVPEVFACTVGQKPSKAKYYVDDTMGVIRLLKAIADASSQKKGILNPVSFVGSLLVDDY